MHQIHECFRGRPMWHDVCFNAIRMRPLLWAGLLVATAVACSAASGSDGDTSEDAITKPGDASPPWLYEGAMPALESPRLVTSIAGHTLRVTGLLPQSFDVAKLPAYAEHEREGARVRVHVVYPIATGKQVNGAW